MPKTWEHFVLEIYKAISEENSKISPDFQIQAGPMAISQTSGINYMCTEIHNGNRIEKNTDTENREK